MINFPFDNIGEAVFVHAQRTPEAAALIAGGETLSYGGLADAVSRAASYLSSLGLQPGERVGLGLGNTIDRIVLSLAVMRLAAVTVELPPGLPEQVLAARVHRFALAATFVEAGGPASPARIAVRVSPGWRNELATHAPMVQMPAPGGSLEIIVLSSGSTGEPKGAVVTHAQRILRASFYLERLGDAWCANGVGPLLLLAPAATSLVSQCLTVQLLLGGPIVLQPPLQNVQDMAQAIASWQGAICPLPPGLIRPFLRLAGTAAPMFPKLRALISSGQPMAAADKLAVLTNITPNFHEIYGASGCGLIAHAGPTALAANPGSVGCPVSGPGIEVQIVNHEREAVPAGVPGRLRLRGPVVAQGFYNSEDNLGSPEHYAEGWYYPGEVALLDHAGNLILQGRVQDAMRLAGGNIYPPAIEDALTRYPGIAEAAVVARKAGEGEEIAAFVVPLPQFRLSEFSAHCNAALPPERRPREIIQLPALPRTGNGKLDRAALRQRANEKELHI